MTAQNPQEDWKKCIPHPGSLFIVGDPKQMPPTSFFATNTVDEDNLEAEDLESILDDCLALNMPQSHLLWHYRSRHESLIAFSNSQFYENKLFTFPSVNDRVSKVPLTRVDGVFDRGKTRTNRAEALAVLEEIQRRYKDPALSKQSLGVVTFNISQQNLIDDLLNAACTQDPELEKWAYGSEEPVFIKNLENVQGDERDVILFSIGYGPDKNGKVSMNFGPLNLAGGERRLNVAVTRSRYEMMVFSSLHAKDIDLRRSNAKGVQGLHRFLDYAENGTLIENAYFQDAQQMEKTITLQIAKKLEERGVKVNTFVGKSRFKVNIAIVDPRNEEKYVMGILLDDKIYHAIPTMSDREIVQPSVLKSLDWRIKRVWTLDWFERPDHVIENILNEINCA